VQCVCPGPCGVRACVILPLVGSSASCGIEFVCPLNVCPASEVCVCVCLVEAKFF
jgi:hypothetical protein